ncbi:MAG: DNA-directed RNA polymerase subunit omega [Anaerostipes sp.]|jgi:DNA-directed RNA polymerase subunit omega|nr:DNA-directed RNA polymerase subunit omega [Anaerostipes sp.]MDD3745273.1 DNA-directed RNA polymerase subunit omega [Anaerostipes sp.]
MLHPSYSELMEVVNGDDEDKNIISSRYSIVIASSKRARQLIAGDVPMVAEPENRKPLSVAVDELQSQMVKILDETLEPSEQ